MSQTHNEGDLFINEKGDTKRLRILLADELLQENVYLLYVSKHILCTLKDFTFFREHSFGFRRAVEDAEAYKKSALVVAIKRVCSTHVYAIDGDVAEEDTDATIEFDFDSNDFLRERVRLDMVPFYKAIEQAMTKKHSAYPAQSLLFMYLRMYATNLFGELGEGKYNCKLMGELPKLENEVGYLCIWKR